MYLHNIVQTILSDLCIAFELVHGGPADRIDITCYGNKPPFSPGHNEAAWAKNCHTHFGPGWIDFSLVELQRP